MARIAARHAARFAPSIVKDYTGTMQAAFSLSVLPTRGHSALRFSRASFEGPQDKTKSVQTVQPVQSVLSVPSVPAVPAGGRGMAEAAKAIDFLNIVTKLKDQKRAGWILRNVKNPESIADHMYRMAVMALLAKDLPGIDREKCVKMAIVHDIAEAIAGDITPSDGVSKEEKRRREQEAMDQLSLALGGGVAAEEMRELWEEYEANSSAEAKLVKDFDKVEMILQASEYEEEQKLVLQDFFDSTKGKFQTEVGISWAAEIVRRRDERLSSVQKTQE